MDRQDQAPNSDSLSSLAELDQATRERFLRVAAATGLHAVARKIYAKEIDPEKIQSKDEFCAIVLELGRSAENAFEFHEDKLDPSIELIRICIGRSDYRAAIVLLFTLFERQINVAIRTLLRVRGFSQGRISNSLQGADLECKMDVILPLLGVKPFERFRQTVLECKTIRNLVVHDKAIPELWHDAGDHTGDSPKTTARAETFFATRTVDAIAIDARTFFDDSIASSVPLTQAWMLFRRFLLDKQP